MSIGLGPWGLGINLDKRAVMTDFAGLMKQAQDMQAKLAEAQTKLAEATFEGTSGGGLVKVTLKGAGELQGLIIDPSLIKAEEAEILSDLIVAAHADARRKLEANHAEVMRQATGPLAALGNMPGMPKFF